MEDCAITFKLSDARFIFSLFLFGRGRKECCFGGRIGDNGFRGNILQLHKKSRLHALVLVGTIPGWVYIWSWIFVPKFPICKTDIGKDNCFNGFCLLTVYDPVNFVSSVQDFTWWMVLLYNRTLTEFYP